VEPFRAVARSAAAQHGVVTRGQILAYGGTPGVLKRWVAAGRLEVVGRSTYRLAGSPPTWEQRLLGAVFAAGPESAASHRSAARLWALTDDRTLELTVSVRRAPVVPGVVVHRSSDIEMGDVVTRRGVPTTTPMRTLVDLGAVVSSRRVEDALDAALEHRLLTLAAVEGALGRLARRGRNGAGVLRDVLERRALGDRPPDSRLEPKMARLLAAYGIPRPQFQHEVRHGGRFVARLDFAYPEARLAVEVDGWGSHSSPRALQSDLERQNALVEMGWTVLRFTWHDVVRRPEAVARRVRRMLAPAVL
jgi:very-short-patch-repair endonuclease